MPDALKIAFFNRFEIALTAEEALGASHPGPCDDDVSELSRVAHVEAQLDALPPDDIREELREYGVWDAQELRDDNANMGRILWLAACQIREDLARNQEEAPND